MNLLVIKTLADATMVRTLVNYATENEALAALYYELWYSTSDENVKAVVVEIISDDGRIIKCERYAVPIAIPRAEIKEEENNE